MLDTDAPTIGTVETRRAPGGVAAATKAALASETPVDRGEYVEILTCTREAVDLSRFPLPVLLQHDHAVQVAIAENPVIGPDRVLRADIRFSASAEAQTIKADVDAGIRRNLSVGYRIDKFERASGGNGRDVPVIRAVRWCPMEVSIVSVPADHKVGFGRSINPLPASSGGQEISDMTTDTNAAEVAAERERISLISDLGERHAMPKAQVRAAIDNGTTIEDWRSAVLAKLSSKPVALGAPPAHTNGERAFSIGNMIAAQVSGNWSGAGFEREVSHELTVRFGKAPQGMHVPPEAFSTRATLTSSGLSDHFSSEHRPDLFIEALKPHAAVLRLGASKLTGVKDIDIPKWLSGSTVAWVAENTAPADSAPTPDTVSLSYHQLSATGVVSRKVVVQADPSFDFTFKADVLRQFGVEVDRVAINGSGSGAEPRGILNMVGLANVPIDTNGGALAWADVVALQAAVEAENITGNTFGWLTNSLVKAAMMTTPRLASTDSRMILEDTMIGADGMWRLANAPIAFSGNVPATLSKGTGEDLSALLYGNWSDLMIGQFGPLDVITDPYTESAKGNVRISVHSAFDVNVRYLESFAAITDIIA